MGNYQFFQYDDELAKKHAESFAEQQAVIAEYADYVGTKETVPDFKVVDAPLPGSVSYQYSYKYLKYPTPYDKDIADYEYLIQKAHEVANYEEAGKLTSTLMQLKYERDSWLANHTPPQFYYPQFHDFPGISELAKQEEEKKKAEVAKAVAVLAAHGSAAYRLEWLREKEKEEQELEVVVRERIAGFEREV